MGRGKEPEDPPKDFKLEMLQSESESNMDLLERISSGHEDDYAFDEDNEYSMYEEIQSNVLRWIDDIENESDGLLSKNDLEFRTDLIQNLILCHEDIIRVDETLTSEDQRSINQDIRNLKEWKRYLKKWKKVLI